MNNKKIILSFLLVLLVALSASAISAQDVTDDVVAADADADDVVAVDEAVDDVVADTYKPTSNDADAVQAAIDKVNKSGDIVDLSDYSSYDFKNKTVNVNKNNIIIQGNIETTINGTGDSNGIFYITGSNVTLRGIQFMNTNPKNNITYGGAIEGIAVKAFRVNDLTIEGCEFYDFNQDIRVQASNRVTIQNNGFYGGIALGILNDPTVNNETGTKALNIMGSSFVTVFNNTFGGPVLDAISIASGSGSNKVINNTIVGAAYAIYFGGASTKGSTIAYNEFINCGSFKENGTDLEGMPAISIQKSSDGIAIENNTFQATDNNILIAGEAGNEAHGSPTRMGDVNITGNTILPYNDTVDMSTVTLLYVLVRDGSSFAMDSALNVTNNQFPTGVKGISVWFDDHEIFTADETVLTDTLYPATLYNTTIETSDVTVTAGEMGYLKVTLKDSNNVTLRDKDVIITFGDNYIIATTNTKGVIEFPFIENVAGTKYATIMYMGEGSIYKSSLATAKVTINAKPAPAVVKKATTLTAKKATLKVKKAKTISVTLKSNGKAVSGKKVTIKVNKKTFSAKTNAKGIAKIKVKVTKKGKFNAVVKFAGDSAYNAVSKTVKYTVKK